MTDPSRPRGITRPTPGAAAGPPRRRLVGLLVVLSLLFVGIIGRLADLQLVAAERYVAYGTSQRLRAEELPASRGSLLDRTGAELVLSVPAQTVIVDPRMIDDPLETARTLAPVLDDDVATLASRLSADSAFEYLARQIDDETAADVQAQQIEGVFLRPEPRRTHPAGNLARGVLGSADIDGVGVSGLEAQFDDVLTGTAGEVLFERSLNGVAIPVGQQQLEPAQPGDDIVLTLDRSLQFLTQEALAEQVRATGANGGQAVVMVPSTGEILAMVSLVVDDEGEVVPATYNRTLVDTFAPGSVLKLSTVGASLEEGRSTPGRAIEVPYALNVGGHMFQDSTLHGTEMWPVSRILIDSSNVGAIKLGQELGEEQVHGYLTRFGFGQSTGLGFPGESAGRLRPVEEWHGSDIAGVIIGTGVTVTAMQVLAGYNVVANDGVYVAPRLVDARVDAEGGRHRAAAVPTRRVVSERTSGQLREMLEGVVSDGTGTHAAVPGYQVAGKTGTSWKLQADGSFENGRGTRDYMATFVGFAPSNDPRVSVIVVIDQPRNVYSGGSAAAPAFSRIVEHALRRLDVPPTSGDDREGTGHIVTVGSTESRVRATPAVAGDDAHVDELDG
ncbi:MAG: penicillin-binding protein 2 [Acidimicrobiia bacterium]|nr:penicillin-binding protein 2 [Acidimicrobiia bacterium]